MMLILLAGLQSRDPEVMEAARVDGASPWQMFRFITLPHMRQYLELAGLLGTIFILQTFDAVVRHHLRRPGHGEPAVHDLPNVLQRARLRLGLGARRGRSGRLVDHRDVRRCARVVAATRGEDLMTTAVAQRPDRSTDTRTTSQDGAAGNALLGLLAWVIGVIFIIPVLWMVLTSLSQRGRRQHQPAQHRRAADPPGLPTVLRAGHRAPARGRTWRTRSQRASSRRSSCSCWRFPAAYALSIRPVRKWSDVMFFFLSTKMLPLVAGLLPIYLFAQKASHARQPLHADHPLHLDEPADRGLDDAVVPRRGAARRSSRRPPSTAPASSTSMRKIVAPIAVPGIAATSLICFIFSWNELLFALVLTGVRRRRHRCS